MKKISFVILMASFCIACNHTTITNGTDDIILDLNSVSAINPKAEISLSDLGWTAELIPLQITTDESLIREIEQIKESDGFFWILADRKLFQFGKDGSFQKQIGRVGRGPGEYVGVQHFSIDEKNKEIYIMDYFGRKMNVYTWDNSFKYSFPLPEDYSFDGFFLSEDNQFYFYSMINAVMPDVLLYDPRTQQADTLSYREREMGMEGFLGHTTMYDLNGDTYVYHYFNDTVYTIRNNRLETAWFISASKMTYRFLELEIQGDYTPTEWPDGPRLWIDRIIETPQYIFAFYKLDENSAMFKPDIDITEKYKTLMAMYDKTDGTYYPHVNIVSDDQPWLTLKDGSPFYYSACSNSLLAAKDAAGLIEDHAIDGLEWDDNPVIIRYSLK